MTCCKIHPRVMTPQEEARELEDPLQWLPPGQLERMSQVAAFYEGASVFLTGATGFIGTLILEKLLRSCPGLSRVYVLVRDKKGVPLRERLRSHLDKQVFSKARQACPDYLNKVVPVAGDCMQPGLGMSEADAEELASKVSVVFHVAANVRFDADLRTATLTNVTSTLEVVALAKRMRNLKALIYMSTAYSNAPIHDIEEKFYPPGLSAEELLKLVTVMDDQQLAQLTPMILGDWPNTYTFTKAIAEDVVRADCAGLPVSVIRPSIVTGTFQEPLALWAGNMYGPVALGAGCAVGLLHVLHLDSSALSDGMPADMVSNATIVCAWDTWRRHSMQKPTEPVVYNCVSSTRHPVTWGDVCSLGKAAFGFPSMRNIWVCCFTEFKNQYLYFLTAVLFHLVPAVIADTILRLRGMKPELWDLYSRVHGASQALQPFMKGEWRFRDDNLASVLRRIGPADRKLFPFDIADCDVEWLLSNAWRGARYYLLHESFDNVDAAMRRYRWLLVLHYTLVFIAGALLLYLLRQIGTSVTGL